MDTSKFELTDEEIRQDYRESNLIKDCFLSFKFERNLCKAQISKVLSMLEPVELEVLEEELFKVEIIPIVVEDEPSASIIRFSIGVQTFTLNNYFTEEAQWMAEIPFTQSSLHHIFKAAILPSDSLNGGEPCLNG